ncbi:MAG: hypothetical protein LUG21_04525, partial [Clostridiales bacterium]|nr:hypothetical protein [Clostridiales bacterium]
CCSLLMPMYEQVQFDWYIKDFCDAKNSFNVTNEKLQITYKEKFDRGIEIKNLKSEIKVLNKELKENSKLLNNKYFKRFFKIYNFLKKIIKRK